MAANLVEAETQGHRVRPVPGPHQVEQLVAAGGRGAEDMAGAVADADVVATMVPDSPMYGRCWRARAGYSTTALPGRWSSTFQHPADVAAALAADGAKRGFRMLDAPVSGGEQGAVDGVLSIMVGGAAEDFEAAAPLFGAVGKTVVHVGPAGSGRRSRPRTSSWWRACGTACRGHRLLRGLRGGHRGGAARAGRRAGREHLLQRKGAAMLARDFKPGFRIALHHKDMGIVTAAAREAGVVIPLGAVAAQRRLAEGAG